MPASVHTLRMSAPGGYRVGMIHSEIHDNSLVQFFMLSQIYGLTKIIEDEPLCQIFGTPFYNKPKQQNQVGLVLCKRNDIILQGLQDQSKTILIFFSLQVLCFHIHLIKCWVKCWGSP